MLLLLCLLLVLSPLLLVGAQEMPVEASTSTLPPLGIFTKMSNNRTAPAVMPEPMWSPSPPDLTPMMPPAPPMTQAVFPVNAAVAHSPPPQQQQQQQQQPPQQQQQPPPPQQQRQQQPFVPGNYYLPAEDFPGNQYGPAINTPNEYRSESYGNGYPPFEQQSSFQQPSFQQPTFPMQAQNPQLDTSLIPTAKHFVLVSFIGLLLLFAIIQNSISAARRKDALVEVLSNRKKRDIVALTNFESMTPEVESALKEDARIRCIQRTLCYENLKLQQDLGIFGKLLAKYLTRNVQSSLKDLSPGWDRLVEDAANAGLRGEDCHVLYRDCSSEFASETEMIEEDED